MAKELQRAHATGKLRVVSGRASDFFGPRVRNSAVGEQVFRAALAGKKARVMINADNLHTFSYVPDIGKGLVEFGEHDEALGQAWHLPNAPTVTTREFLKMVYSEAGQEVAIQVAP